MSYGKYKILLIEDDFDDAEMIMHALRKLSFVEITHIDDSVDAVQYLFNLENPDPRVILLDLKMPKIDGIQILRMLKGNMHRKHIPVIALISSKDGRKYLESFNLRADSYLTKPIDCTNFLVCLTEIGLAHFNFEFPMETDRPHSNTGF
jgi:two-component system response regulator